MHQLRQASVKLPGTSQNAGCCIHHTLLMTFKAPARTTLQ